MKLIHADCLLEMRTIQDRSIDCIIVDPPYTSPTVTAFGRKQVKNYADFSIQEGYMRCLKEEFERILKKDGALFIFCDEKYYPVIFKVFYSWKANQMLIWDKQKIGMGKPFRKRHELIFYANRETVDYRRTPDITHYPTVPAYKPVGKSRLHGAQKPVALISDLLKGFTSEGETVLDCFMGSGTTGIACEDLDREFIGIELNKEYFEAAKTRLEEHQKQLQLIPTQ